MREKKTKMVKFRWYFDTDKETEWLNLMAEKGWALTGFCLGFYRFERCEPGEYIYQIDATDKLFGVSEDYRQFMEEMGAEIVCIWGLYAFLRRKAAEGPFQLYTDVEFTISHYSKIINRFETVEAMEAAGMLSGIYCAVQEINTFGWVLALLAGSLFLVFQRQAARVKKELKELKIGGMALKGEDETIHLACTGNQVQSEFLPVFLESGSYTLCFYYLTCEEDWLEYCEITGLEAGNLVDYFWEPGLPAVFTGSYQIYSNLSEENSASNSASGGN